MSKFSKKEFIDRFIDQITISLSGFSGHHNILTTRLSYPFSAFKEYSRVDDSLEDEAEKEVRLKVALVSQAIALLLSDELTHGDPSEQFQTLQTLKRWTREINKLVVMGMTCEEPEAPF